ncbi:U7 small nuclear RNA associated Lsm10 [Rhodnius prolixus]|uniref:Putative small nuclear ribonucleoprotein smd1 n=2 Tax=Rhodnius TaxID=13248 RepID=R4G3G1_RHOPR
MNQLISVKNLLVLAKGLVGKYVLVDLRNDSAVNGKIDDIDSSMNVTMSDVIFTDAGGNEYYYNIFFIKERNIRYIHIPTEVDINNLIVSSLEKIRNPKKRVINLKTSRLMQRQLETLQRVEEIKKAKQKMKEQLMASTSKE